jgi:anti-sigma factor RsiW
MSNCAFRARLDAYHDGELSSPERSVVEAHLRGCPSCAAEVAAMQQMTSTFAGNVSREASHEQLLQMAQSVRVERTNLEMLARLFRGTAVAAAVLLAGVIAAALYLPDRTKAAAHQAMVLDHAATLIEPAASSPDALSDARQSEQQVRLAQWIADDLAGGRRER